MTGDVNVYAQVQLVRRARVQALRQHDGGGGGGEVVTLSFQK